MPQHRRGNAPATPRSQSASVPNITTDLIWLRLRLRWIPDVRSTGLIQLFNVPDESVQNRLEIYGSAGSLVAEGTLGQSHSGTLRWTHRESVLGYDEHQGRAAESTVVDFALRAGNLYQAQIEDFSRAVQLGRTPMATGQQGLWIQQVLAACNRLAGTNTAQHVEFA